MLASTTTPASQPGPSTSDSAAEQTPPHERVVVVRARTILAALGIVLGVGAALGFVLRRRG
jgi:hypothetical protein